jgi:hypothetical protein
MSPEELRQATSRYRRPELDPLADAIRAWGQGPASHHFHDASRCGAANEPGALVNINENTSAAPGGEREGGGRETTIPM